MNSPMSVVTKAAVITGEALSKLRKACTNEGHVDCCLRHPGRLDLKDPDSG
jgi:hypothetical protein